MKRSRQPHSGQQVIKTSGLNESLSGTVVRRQPQAGQSSVIEAGVVGMVGIRVRSMRAGYPAGATACVAVRSEMILRGNCHPPRHD